MSQSEFDEIGFDFVFNYIPSSVGKFLTFIPKSKPYMLIYYYNTVMNRYKFQSEVRFSEPPVSVDYKISSLLNHVFIGTKDGQLRKYEVFTKNSTSSTFPLLITTGQFIPSNPQILIL